MTILDLVKSSFDEWPAPSASGQQVIIPTHCLYPSNSSVTIFVEGGKSEFVVHDNGGAVEEAASSGAHFEKPHRLIGHIVRSFGLTVDSSGIIRSGVVPANRLLSTIVLVANASKEASHELLDKYKPKIRRNFRSDLATMLEIKFQTLVSKNPTLIGKSNKAYSFDHKIEISADRQIILDAVMHDASSINSVVVSNLDVREAHHQGVEQFIVYDDHEKWTSSELYLLKMAARPVAFSQTSEVLERLAA